MSTPIATFQVIKSHGIPERNYFILRGKVTSGEVLPGMDAGIGLNPPLDAGVRISEVCRLEHSDKKEADTLLIIHCEDELEYDLLMSLKVYDEEVRITPRQSF